MSRQNDGKSSGIEDIEDNVSAVLKEKFGLSEFRGRQREVIDRVLSGGSALLIMPTGMGKSLTFQLPAHIFWRRSRQLTLVISPLIALMKDQVDAAQRLGLRAAFINSSLTGEERAARYEKLAQRQYELLYVTPERFRIAAFREALARNELALLAIDEAHCISSWGHDFRPDYSRLGDYREELGFPPTLALTATATREVQADILQQLRLQQDQRDQRDQQNPQNPQNQREAPHLAPLNPANACYVFEAGIERPNLAIEVLNVHGMDEKIRAFFALQHQWGGTGSTIVYFSLIQTLRSFSDQLGRLGVQHLTYHGQLPDRERRRAQERFLREEMGIVLATPAFGLGIDKPNVRLVLHAEIPGSLEAYYQEIGRAGRDGNPSGCVLLFDEDDVSIQRDFLGWSNPDPGFIQAVYNLIERNLLRARQEGFDYLRTQMSFYNRRDFRVETAVGLLERWGSLEGREPRAWTPVQSPPAEFLDVNEFGLRMKTQKDKLMQMAQFAVEGDRCRMQYVRRYFVGDWGNDCGLCDVCVRTRQEGGERA